MATGATAKQGLAAGLVLATAVLAATAHGVLADPGETARKNTAPATTVSGVTVMVSRSTPRVVATFPANGATVAPGVLVLRVSFDEPMYAESWSYVTSPSGDYPDCAAAPRRLDDRKSFVLICRTAGKKDYALWFNRAPYANFLSLARKPATPFLLMFKTSDADPVWTLQEAMKVDPGLPAGANPAEPEGKRRPGETVDTDSSDIPPAPDQPAPPAKPG